MRACGGFAGGCMQACRCMRAASLHGALALGKCRCMMVRTAPAPMNGMTIHRSDPRRKLACSCRMFAWWKRRMSVASRAIEASSQGAPSRFVILTATRAPSGSQTAQWTCSGVLRPGAGCNWAPHVAPAAHARRARAHSQPRHTQACAARPCRRRVAPLRSLPSRIHTGARSPAGPWASPYWRCRAAGCFVPCTRGWRRARVARSGAQGPPDGHRVLVQACVVTQIRSSRPDGSLTCPRARSPPL